MLLNTSFIQAINQKFVERINNKVSMTCIMERCNRVIRQIWLESSLKTSNFFLHERIDMTGKPMFVCLTYSASF